MSPASNSKPPSGVQTASDHASGVLKLTTRGGGVLLDPAWSFRPTGRDPVIPAGLAREYGLVEGAFVIGPVRSGKAGLELTSVDSVCGLTTAAFGARTRFDRLIPVDPQDRFHLGTSGDLSMRAMDLVAPIGKGTRGLIVSPPKAGKTTLLSKIATAIGATAPETRVIVLLIDERPEEVTYFRRGVEAEVIASSSDQPLKEHLALLELMLAHIRVELECGRDVVVLLDSLTRLARAFNLGGKDRGRSLSGGLDAGALEIPRRFFGLARNIESGGSVTIVASILVDTGSRMDQVIFEELKATGNSEIVLDRELAQAGIFPAINIPASGTRREERLYGPDEIQRIRALRRGLGNYKPREAMLALLKLLDQYPTNESLLRSLRVAPQA
jgi:transcription termination factor Rho